MMIPASLSPTVSPSRRWWMARIKVDEILAHLKRIEGKPEENYQRLLKAKIAAMPAKERRLRIEARGKLLREELRRRRK